MNDSSNGWKIAGAAVVGMLAGAGAASWIAPKVIAWYFDPPAQFGVSCREPIEWALARLRTTQLVGSLIGAVLGIIAFFWLRGKLRPRIETHLPPPRGPRP